MNYSVHYLKCLVFAVALPGILLMTPGCASEPKRLPPVVVEVPVREPCIEQLPPAPDYETQYLQEGDSLCVITDALLVERLQRIIYEEQLKAAIAGCMIEANQ